jgi:hypothetical protein
VGQTLQEQKSGGIRLALNYSLRVGSELKVFSSLHYLCKCNNFDL